MYLSKSQWTELGLFLILLTFGYTVASESELAKSAECYYNYNHYSEGDRILTNEPCLNCTCHNKMLMCYLKVCPFTKPIGQDCTIEKREDQCCPIITCPEVPVELDSSSGFSSTGLAAHQQYGCTIDDKFYPEGAQVPGSPKKPCELCYCIRNMTSCVMQECTLHVDGCRPIYNKGICCPVRYDCAHELDESHLLEGETTTTEAPSEGFVITTTSMPPQSTDCIHNGVQYVDGELITTDQPCEHCYCMRGDIVCAVQECAQPMNLHGKNCTAAEPKHGECCPQVYSCEGDEQGTTEQIELATAPPVTSRAEISGESDRTTESGLEVTEVPASTEQIDESENEIHDDHGTEKPIDKPGSLDARLEGETTTVEAQKVHETTLSPSGIEEGTKDTTTESGGIFSNLFTTLRSIVEFTTTTDESLVGTTIQPSRDDLFDNIIPGEGDCLQDGVSYLNNTNVQSQNKCDSSCVCLNSVVRCVKIECPIMPPNAKNCRTIQNAEQCCAAYECDDLAVEITTEIEVKLATTEPDELRGELTTQMPESIDTKLGEGDADKVTTESNLAPTEKLTESSIEEMSTDKAGEEEQTTQHVVLVEGSTESVEVSQTTFHAQEGAVTTKSTQTIATESPIQTEASVHLDEAMQHEEGSGQSPSESTTLFGLDERIDDHESTVATQTEAEIAGLTTEKVSKDEITDAAQLTTLSPSSSEPSVRAEDQTSISAEEPTTQSSSGEVKQEQTTLGINEDLTTASDNILGKVPIASTEKAAEDQTESEISSGGTTKSPSGTDVDVQPLTESIEQPQQTTESEVIEVLTIKQSSTEHNLRKDDGISSETEAPIAEATTSSESDHEPVTTEKSAQKDEGIGSHAETTTYSSQQEGSTEGIQKTPEGIVTEVNLPEASTMPRDESITLTYNQMHAGHGQPEITTESEQPVGTESGVTQSSASSTDSSSLDLATPQEKHAETTVSPIAIIEPSGIEPHLANEATTQNLSGEETTVKPAQPVDVHTPVESTDKTPDLIEVDLTTRMSDAKTGTESATESGLTEAGATEKVQLASTEKAAESTTQIADGVRAEGTETITEGRIIQTEQSESGSPSEPTEHEVTTQIADGVTPEGTEVVTEGGLGQTETPELGSSSEPAEHEATTQIADGVRLDITQSSVTENIGQNQASTELAKEEITTQAQGIIDQSIEGTTQSATEKLERSEATTESGQDVTEKLEEEHTVKLAEASSSTEKAQDVTEKEIVTEGTTQSAGIESLNRDGDIGTESAPGQEQTTSHVISGQEQTTLHAAPGQEQTTLHAISEQEQTTILGISEQKLQPSTSVPLTEEHTTIHEILELEQTTLHAASEVEQATLHAVLEQEQTTLREISEQKQQPTTNIPLAEEQTTLHAATGFEQTTSSEILGQEQTTINVAPGLEQTTLHEISEQKQQPTTNVPLAEEQTTMPAAPGLEQTTLHAIPEQEQTTLHAAPELELTTSSEILGQEQTTINIAPGLEQTTLHEISEQKQQPTNVPLAEELTTSPAAPGLEQTTLHAIPEQEQTTLHAAPGLELTTSSEILGQEQTTINIAPGLEQTTLHEISEQKQQPTNVPFAEEQTTSPAAPGLEQTTLHAIPEQEQTTLHAAPGLEPTTSHEMSEQEQTTLNAATGLEQATLHEISEQEQQPTSSDPLPVEQTEGPSGVKAIAEGTTISSEEGSGDEIPTTISSRFQDTEQATKQSDAQQAGEAQTESSETTVRSDEANLSTLAPESHVVQDQTEISQTTPQKDESISLATASPVSKEDQQLAEVSQTTIRSEESTGHEKAHEAQGPTELPQTTLAPRLQNEHTEIPLATESPEKPAEGLQIMNSATQPQTTTESENCTDNASESSFTTESSSGIVATTIVQESSEKISESHTETSSSEQPGTEAIGSITTEAQKENETPQTVSPENVVSDVTQSDIELAQTTLSDLSISETTQSTLDEAQTSAPEKSAEAITQPELGNLQTTQSSVSSVIQAESELTTQTPIEVVVTQKDELQTTQSVIDISSESQADLDHITQPSSEGLATTQSEIEETQTTQSAIAVPSATQLGEGEAKTTVPSSPIEAVTQPESEGVQTKSPEDEIPTTVASRIDVSGIQGESSATTIISEQVQDADKQEQTTSSSIFDSTTIKSIADFITTMHPKRPSEENATNYSTESLEGIETTSAVTPAIVESMNKIPLIRVPSPDESSTELSGVEVTTSVPFETTQSEQEIPKQTETTVSEAEVSSTQAQPTSSTTTQQTTTQAPLAPTYDNTYGVPPHYPDDEYPEEEEPAAFGPGTCRYGGKLYVSAQQIPRDDPCDFCFCFRSDIICLQQSCPPPISGCHEEPIQGFCCPRYECPVSMGLVVNTTSTTTTTTLPPHMANFARNNGKIMKSGCQIQGATYKTGQRVVAASGPCIDCICGGDGQMKCEPKACTPEPMLRQMIALAASRR